MFRKALAEGGNDIGEMRKFRRDPLVYLEACSRRSVTEVFVLPWGAWCVRDTDLALTLLRDPEFNSGMAPFFGDMLPSRQAQMALGRAVRNTVRAYLPVYRERVAQAVTELPPTSNWPDAGPVLVHQSMSNLLLHSGAPHVLHRLMGQAVRGNGGLMGRAARMRHRARAELLRPKVYAVLTTYIEERRRRNARDDGERNVLDALLATCPEEVTDETAAKLFMLLFRSIVGTVGHSAAWALLLAHLRHPAGPPWPWPADWITREAARHRPLVWMVGREAPRSMDFGGLAVPSGTILSVSPYLLHHDPSRWSNPTNFEPARWDGTGEIGPYLPFSAGPFTCAGASVAHDLITETIAALAETAHLTVVGGDPRPLITDASVPRPFTLQRATAHHKAPVCQRR